MAIVYLQVIYALPQLWVRLMVYQCMYGQYTRSVCVSKGLQLWVLVHVCTIRRTFVNKATLWISAEVGSRQQIQVLQNP